MWAAGSAVTAAPAAPRPAPGPHMHPALPPPLCRPVGGGPRPAQQPARIHPPCGGRRHPARHAQARRLGALGSSRVPLPHSMHAHAPVQRGERCLLRAFLSCRWEDYDAGKLVDCYLNLGAVQVRAWVGTGYFSIGCKLPRCGRAGCRAPCSPSASTRPAGRPATLPAPAAAPPAGGAGRGGRRALRVVFCRGGTGAGG